MGFGRHQRAYDRARILLQAERARRRGRAAKAVALYRRVLAVEPDNVDLHRKLAPLLVRCRQPDAAWRSYRCAAEILAGRGFAAQATGVLREAASQLPRSREVWVAVADRILENGRRLDAKSVLLAGRAHFRSRSQRRTAIDLLTRALELDPDDLSVGLDLAQLLARSGARNHALRILARLAASHPVRRRQIHFVRLRTAPSLRSLVDWLRELTRPASSGARIAVASSQGRWIP
jgi:predicted Zn-dependent protease